MIVKMDVIKRAIEYVVVKIFHFLMLETRSVICLETPIYQRLPSFPHF